MRFRPVINLHKSKYPIWEITEIEIPDKVYDSIKGGTWTVYDEFIKSKTFSQPVTRFILEDHDRFSTQFISDEINTFIYSQKHYDLSLIQKKDPDFINKIRTLPWKIDLNKDIANYKLGVHVDNSQFAGTCIINLRDNQTVTEYFADKDGKELIFKGSGKKGTGVLHLNTPYTFHSVTNTSGEDRYILHGVLNNPRVK